MMRLKRIFEMPSLPSVKRNFPRPAFLAEACKYIGAGALAGRPYGMSARVLAGALAAAVAFALAGCTAPVTKASVDVPGRFATASESEDQPEAKWWESFGDPVLSDLIRRAARENRDVKIAAERVRAARAGETVSRSWLFPSISAVGGGFDQRTGYSDAARQL